MSLNTCMSERIPRLREYYMENAPLSVHRELTPWLCHRTKLLYTEGWLRSGHAPTTRLRRAMAEKWLLEHTEPIICEGELIVGQPDYFPFSEEEARKYKEMDDIYENIIPPRRGRFDHVALDYKPLLALGVEGLIAKLRAELEGIDYHAQSSASDYEFFTGCITELEGVLTLADRYARHAASLAEQASGKQREEYAELAEILRQVPAKPARSFHEALQSIHLFTFSLYGLYSAGRPDQLLIDYYRNDIKNGILTEARAQELIDCYCLQYIPNMSQWAAAGFMVGGRDENGRAVENELTRHFLASISHTHTPDPNIGLCLTEETSDELVRFVADMILKGESNPQLWNNDAVKRAMLAAGFEEKASNLYTQSTCVEVTPIGCSGISITSPYINALRIFLEAFDACDNSTTWEELLEAFAEQLDRTYAKMGLEENLWQLERGRNGTDPMRISVLTDDCIRERKTNDAGGARYNQMEPSLVGLINVVESLNVIKALVYDQKALTIRAFQDILKANYEGHEELLLRIKKKVKHFGNGDPAVDEIAKQVADRVVKTFDKFTTARGAKVLPGAFSYRDHARHGAETGASPDGRRSGETLVAGSGPMQGYDTKGPTLAIMSTSAWDPARFLGGIAINIKLARSTDPEAFVAFVKGFLKTNCPQMQITVVNQEELIDAQKHPENHGDLLVRVGGYSDFFVKCPPNLQNEIISRSGG